jgi:hypothetical protein
VRVASRISARPNFLILFGFCALDAAVFWTNNGIPLINKSHRGWAKDLAHPTPCFTLVK